MKKHILAVHEGKKSHNKDTYSKKHILAVHECKKLYKCMICEKSFSQKGNLNTHIVAVHEGQKSHKCSFCENNVSQKAHLKNHILAVHKIIIYVSTYVDRWLHIYHFKEYINEDLHFVDNLFISLTT